MKFVLEKKELTSISDIEVRTLNENEENNNFKIFFKKKISIIGKKYDATNLLKLLTNDSNTNLLKNFTKEENEIITSTFILTNEMLIKE